MIGTKFNIIDLSKIPEQTVIETPDAAPVILTAFPSAKGTEKLVEMSGTDYRTMFGDPDYKKYGQVSVQNQRMIDAGAKLLCKRIVASDAKLSNVTLVAKVSASIVTTDRVKKDDEGHDVTQTVQNEGGQQVQVPVYETEKQATIDYVAVETNDAQTMEDITTKFGVKGKLVDGAPIELSADNYTDYGFEEISEEDAKDTVVFIPTEENTADVRALNDNEETATDLSTLVSSFKIEEGESCLWIVKKDALDGEGDEAKLKVDATVDQIVDAATVYPIMTVAELGRGTSKKSFSITPENAISKNLSFMYYTLNIIEDGATIETIRFAMKPDTIYNGKCIDLNMVASTDLAFSQIHAYEDSITAFIKALAMASANADEAELGMNDFIFGTLRKGTAYPNIAIAEYSSLVDSLSTIDLRSDPSADGSFGSTPALDKHDEITKKLVAFFSDTPISASVGEYTALDTTDDIYDLDTYQIDAVFDANYDIRVKEEIANLANYRGDFMYFRDHGDQALPDGENVTSYVDVAARIDGTYYQKADTVEPDKAAGVMDADWVLPKSTYVCDWVQSYSVINPYDLKEIDVTINYDISRMMISHILNQVNVPFAGKRNNAIITSIIKDTINYKPRVTPNVNEKEELEDIKCNFASYYKNDFTIETLWTSQEDYTQLSFINNVMAVQRVIKALRVHFPSIRYQFITSTDDLTAYTTNINEFLSSYTNMFAELRFEYIQDSVAAANKIYRAALYFRFNDFAQGEQIDAYMLPTEVITG